MADQLRSDQNLIFKIDVVLDGQRLDIDPVADITIDDVTVVGSTLADNMDFDTSLLTITKEPNDGLGEYTAFYPAAGYGRPLTASDRLRVTMRITSNGQTVPLVREFTVEERSNKLDEIQRKLDQAIAAIARLSGTTSDGPRLSSDQFRSIIRREYPDGRFQWDLSENTRSGQGGVAIVIPGLFSRLDPHEVLENPGIATGDVTVTIDGITVDAANLPTTNAHGAVTLEVSPDEYVDGAVFDFSSQNDQWLDVQVFLQFAYVVPTPTIHSSRRHRQLTKAFERDLRAHGIPIAIVRGGFSDASCAIHTQPRYSSSDDEGFITTINTEYFLMRRSDYRSASKVTDPKVGDRIIKTATGESFEVINDDDGRNLDDTQPEIDKLRIPVRRVSA